MSKILLVEDDETIGRRVSDWLVSERQSVEWVTTGEAALLRMKLSDFDIIVLDWELPDMTGIDIVKRLRGKKVAVPILMLTARNTITDKGVGFESGADDYLTKPFDPKELSMRIMALLRRSPEIVEELLSFGDLRLDQHGCCIRRGEEVIKLLPREFDLLAFFMRHQGQLFSAEALLSRVWPMETGASKDIVKVYIARLRSKIDKSGEASVITTVHGAGYRMEPQ